MTAAALRRLQALRGLTRTGSTHTVLAAVQGDLQTVIEAVLELADENTPPEPADAPESDAGPIQVPEDPQGGERLPQGRIGWLRLRRSSSTHRLLLAREVEDGWTQDGTDLGDWGAENFPDAEFTPIPTLAADEVAVNREDLRTALSAVWLHESAPAVKREAVDRLRAALEEGR